MKQRVFLESFFLGIPQIPERLRKFLATISPILAALTGIASTLGFFAIAGLIIITVRNPATLFSVGNLFLVKSVIILAAGLMIGVSTPDLFNGKHIGWKRIYKASLIYYATEAIFLMFGLVSPTTVSLLTRIPGLFFGNIVGLLISFFLSFYLLFQIKSYFRK